MVPAFSNKSISGATVVVNFGAGNISTTLPVSNEILNQSSSAAPEEAWKKLRQ
jgi:hypothetical protein